MSEDDAVLINVLIFGTTIRPNTNTRFSLLFELNRIFGTTLTAGNGVSLHFGPTRLNSVS